ncbi:unnamed protein product [Caenorhabditis brenneri]
MRKPKFIRRILDRFINFKLDLPKTEPPVFVAPLAETLPDAVSTTMRKPKFIRRLLDWCNKLKSDLPKILVALPAKAAPPKKKFPIFRLPFLARKNVLLRLQLDDLIPLSLLSQRSKRMIKQAVPLWKAQYDCTVWSKEVPTIKISSSFGSYSGINPDVDNIMDLLSYPSFQVFVYGENGATRAAEWVKIHRSCINMIAFVAPFNDRGKILELLNPFIALTTRVVIVYAFADSLYDQWEIPRFDSLSPE